MPSPDPFIDTQDLTDYLGYNVTNDPGALIAIDAACDTVRDVASRLFNAGTETVTFDGSGGDCLILPQGPVLGCGTVTVNGGTVTDYCWAMDGRLIRGTAAERSLSDSTHVWPQGRLNVRVTYDYGFADADMPRSVRMVALALASRLLAQGPGAVSESAGDQSATYAGPAMDLTENELRILRYHARTRSF